MPPRHPVDLFPPRNLAHLSPEERVDAILSYVQTIAAKLDAAFGDLHRLEREYSEQEHRLDELHTAFANHTQHAQHVLEQARACAGNEKRIEEIERFNSAITKAFVREDFRRHHDWHEKTDTKDEDRAATIKEIRKMAMTGLLSAAGALITAWLATKGINL